jgi:phosphoglycolate phosphatase
MPTLVVFAIEGSLMNTAAATRAAMDRAFISAFRALSPSQGVPLDDRTDLAIFRDLARQADLPVSEAHASAFFREYGSALAAALVQRAALLLPGAGTLLAALDDDRRCHLAVATGDCEEAARAKLDHFRLGRHFPVGAYGGGTLDRAEILRDAVRVASNHYGEQFDSRGCAIVTAAPTDVRAAREQGLRCLGLATGASGAAAVAEARPDALVPDPTDVRRIVRWLLN